MSSAPIHPGETPQRVEFLGAPFDLDSPESAIARLRMRKAGDRFAYVVTPNADHVVRLSGRPELIPTYRNAWMSLNDSRPIQLLARLRGLTLPRLPGSDAVDRLFAGVIEPGDALAVIGATDELATELRTRFPQFNWAIHVPPGDLDSNAETVDACVQFALANPARYLFLGVGSPRSELLAERIAQCEGATGTALCIGAALEFITERKARAPEFMRVSGLEWLFRLLSEPRRLWRRYLLGAGPLLWLFLRERRRG